MKRWLLLLSILHRCANIPVLRHLIPGRPQGCHGSRFGRGRFLQSNSGLRYIETNWSVDPGNKICDCPSLLATCWYRSKASSLPIVWSIHRWSAVHENKKHCQKKYKLKLWRKSFAQKRDKSEGGLSVQIKMWMRRIFPTAAAASGLTCFPQVSEWQV